MLFFARQTVGFQLETWTGLGGFVQARTAGVIRWHPVLMPGMGLGGSMRRMPVPGMKGKHGRHHDLGPGRDRQEQKRRNGFPQHPYTSRLAEREQAGCDPSHWRE